jgi:hypothetical protein
VRKFWYRGKAAISEAAEVKSDIMRKLHTWLRAAKRKPPTTASSPGWKVDEGGWAVGAGKKSPGLQACSD